MKSIGKRGNATGLIFGNPEWKIPRGLDFGAKVSAVRAEATVGGSWNATGEPPKQ